MTTPLSVIRENEYLRKQLGSEHGHQRYQWAWSGDLNVPMAMMDDEGKPIYDYICPCGKNQRVHSAECTLTVPRQRWETRSLVPTLGNQWVLCSWQPPEASRDEWAANFPGQPYPSGGYLIPIGDPQKCICIPSGQVPYRPTTDLCIAAIREHFTKTGAQRSAETKDRWAENEKKELATLESRCKDAFPVHTGWPGEKHEWSHGGLPEAPSPNLIVASA